MPKLRFLGLVVLVLGVIASCDDSPLGFSGYSQALEAQARWYRHDFKDYDVEFRRLCFCSNDWVQWSRVEVRGGLVVAVHLLEDDTDVPTERLTEWPTIERLFRDILEAQGPYERIAATYDPVYGHPISIDFDAARGVYDAGARYELRALVTTP